jgi:hypothetical protein
VYSVLGGGGAFSESSEGIRVGGNLARISDFPQCAE